MRLSEEQALQDDNRFANCNVLAELKYCGWEIPRRISITNDEIRFYAWLCRSAVAMLKERKKIVRCKDCKYCSSEIRDGIKFAKCELKHNWMPQPEWFCADG